MIYYGRILICLGVVLRMRSTMGYDTGVPYD